MGQTPREGAAAGAAGLEQALPPASGTQPLSWEMPPLCHVSHLVCGICPGGPGTPPRPTLGPQPRPGAWRRSACLWPGLGRAWEPGRARGGKCCRCPGGWAAGPSPERGGARLLFGWAQGGLPWQEGCTCREGEPARSRLEMVPRPQAKGGVRLPAPPVPELPDPPRTPGLPPGRAAVRPSHRVSRGPGPHGAGGPGPAPRHGGHRGGGRASLHVTVHCPLLPPGKVGGAWGEGKAVAFPSPVRQLGPARACSQTHGQEGLPAGVLAGLGSGVGGPGPQLSSSRAPGQRPGPRTPEGHPGRWRPPGLARSARHGDVTRAGLQPRSEIPLNQARPRGAGSGGQDRREVSQRPSRG